MKRSFQGLHGGATVSEILPFGTSLRWFWVLIGSSFQGGIAASPQSLIISKYLLSVPCDRHRLSYGNTEIKTSAFSHQTPSEHGGLWMSPNKYFVLSQRVRDEQEVCWDAKVQVSKGSGVRLPGFKSMQLHCKVRWTWPRKETALWLTCFPLRTIGRI